MSGLYRIKSLEWEDRSDRLGHQEHVANAGFAVYWVRQAYVISSTGGRTEWMRGGHGFRFAKCESLEAGKAACEAHWRARIKQALVPVEVSDTSGREFRICQRCSSAICDIGCSYGCELDGLDDRPPGSVKVRRYRETVIRELLGEEAR